MATYRLTVELANECYEADVEHNIFELWENAEIDYPELFEYAGVPYDPFEKWSREEIVDMTNFDCIPLDDDDDSN